MKEEKLIFKQATSIDKGIDELIRSIKINEKI